MSTFVIFDIDGTLLYSNKIDSQCFADTYQEIYQNKNYTHDTMIIYFLVKLEIQVFNLYFL